MGKRRDPVKEADRALQKEGERQALLIHGAAAIALYRNWGWRKTRILNLLDMVETVWNECAEDIRHSMIEMCVKETGIEIQEQYDMDPQKVQAACLEETDVRIREKLKRKEV